MELQGAGKPVVAAEHAAAAGLLDQLLLHATPPRRDCIAAAAPAAEAETVAAAHPEGVAVLPALADRAVTEDERAKLVAAVQAEGCSGGKFEMDEDDQQFEVDDARISRVLVFRNPDKLVRLAAPTP